MNVEVKDGRVIRTVGHDDGPANDGQLCVRGRFGVVDVVHSLARLKSPLLRRNGRLVEVSWNEALEAVTRGLSQYQGERFATVSSAAASNEENYMLQKFARAVMHSNNVALATGFPEYEGAAVLLGILRTINGRAVRDIRGAASILVIGANVYESHPIIGLEIRHALSRGACLITLDARQTDMTKMSDLWLQPKMGTDHILLAGMIKALTDEGRTVLSRELARLDLARVAFVTGVNEETLARAARMLRERTPTTIIYGSGVTDHPTAPEVIKAIQNLAFALGDAGIVPVPGEGNSVGALDMGVHPSLLPGYRPVSGSKARAGFEAAWKITLSPNPGRNYEGILVGIREGRIKALYLAGEVPPLPELANLPFLVVQDIVSTENMRYAHAVLPATTFAEMDGTLTNLEGRVQRMRQAIPPVGLSRPGWMIVRDLAEHMGTAHWSYRSAAEVMAEIASLVPAYAHVNYETLNVSGALRRFQPTIKAQFVPFSLEKVPQFASDEFPFALITERNLFYYHGACLTEQVKGMNLIKKEEILQLSPLDARKLGVADGSLVKVESRYGSAECIVQATNGIPEGAAFTSINRVVGSPLFPTLAPSTKACAIRISQRMRPSEA